MGALVGLGGVRGRLGCGRCGRRRGGTPARVQPSVGQHRHLGPPLRGGQAARIGQAEGNQPDLASQFQASTDVLGGRRSRAVPQWAPDRGNALDPDPSRNSRCVPAQVQCPPRPLLGHRPSRERLYGRSVPARWPRSLAPGAGHRRRPLEGGRPAGRAAFLQPQLARYSRGRSHLGHDAVWRGRIRGSL